MSDPDPITPAELRLLLARTGLSREETADYLGVQARTVSRWLKGEMTPADQQLQPLRDLCDTQDRMARDAIAQAKVMVAEYSDPHEIHMRLARTIEEAEEVGMPTASAHLAVIRRIAEWAPDTIKIVPAYPGESDAADLAAIVRRMDLDGD